MSNQPKEIILTVPSELTTKSKGLAFDMGGSALKFVFRTKDDCDKANATESTFSRLHLVSFGRNSLEEGLEYIKKNAFFRNEGNKDEILELFTTGVGCTEFGKLINETLNVRLTNLTEFDCFVKSFIYLAQHLPRSELLEKFDVDGLTDPLKQTQSQVKAMQKMQGKNMTQSVDFSLLDAVALSLQSKTGHPTGDQVEPPSKEPLCEAETDLYPCIIAMCGSGFGFLKIEKDGSFKIVDGSLRSGRNFVGIGMLLTGAKSFDELIELASKGNQHNVDMFSDEVLGTQHNLDDDSIYSSVKEMHPVCLFSFGKVASGTGEFRREDIARSWLFSFVMDLAQTSHFVCTVHNAKRLFFSGGFCANELVRFFITQELARRNIMSSFMISVGDTVQFDFIKAGQHLGALGCLLNGVHQFIGN